MTFFNISKTNGKIKIINRDYRNFTLS